MQFNTPTPRGYYVHHKDRSLRLGVPVTVIVDKPKFHTVANLLSPRHYCRRIIDMEPSVASTSVLIDSAFSETVYELYTKTCTTWGGEYLSYTGATPKFLRDSTWWPIARVDNSRTVIGSSRWVWPCMHVETCVAWLMDPSVDPISALPIGAGWRSRATQTLRERLMGWTQLDLDRVLGENRREVCEVVRLCQRVLGLPTHELEYRLERLSREDQL